MPLEGRCPTPPNMQREGRRGPYLEGEALGVAIPNLLVPLVGIGFLLGGGGVPQLSGSSQEGADLGPVQEERHSSAGPSSAQPISSSSLCLFPGCTPHPTPLCWK